MDELVQMKIQRVTKLSEPNLNGIVYDQKSLHECIDKFLKNVSNVNNVTALPTGEYNKDMLDNYLIIAQDTILGRCTDIQDDYVEIIPTNDRIKSFKDPRAIFRMVGKLLDDNTVSIDRLISVDIIEGLPKSK